MAFFYDTLEVLLMDILSVIKPIRGDVLTRYQVIDEFRFLVSQVESLRGATVEPFGSFISNLYTKGGDLDISIELPSNSFVSSVGKKRKQNLLRDLWKALRVKGVRNLQFISHARVPLLIFESQHSISCDISICNVLGLIKSKVFLWITEIDERFRDMVLLVKEWAKSQDINNPKSGTLNSYSLSLLVIFHFQTCEPPILPPLQEIYAGNIGDLTGEKVFVERDIQDKCAKSIARFRAKNVGRSNQSTVAELFFQFFKKFTVLNRMAAEYGVCTYTGKWELKMSKDGWMTKIYPLIVEDPFEQPGNAARAVGKNQLTKISDAFRETYQRLSSNQIQGSLISTLVRPHIRSQLNLSFQGNPNARPGGFGATNGHINPVYNGPRPFMGTIHEVKNRFEKRTVDSSPDLKSQRQQHFSSPSPVYNGPRPFMGAIHEVQNGYEKKTVDSGPGFKTQRQPSPSAVYSGAHPFVGTIHEVKNKYEKRTVDSGPGLKSQIQRHISSPSSSSVYNGPRRYVGTIHEVQNGYEKRAVDPGLGKKLLPHQQFARRSSGQSVESQQVWRPRQSDR